jgi:hypothetical protein
LEVDYIANFSTITDLTLQIDATTDEATDSLWNSIVNSIVNKLSHLKELILTGKATTSQLHGLLPFLTERCESLDLSCLSLQRVPQNESFHEFTLPGV